MYIAGKTGASASYGMDFAQIDCVKVFCSEIDYKKLSKSHQPSKICIHIVLQLTALKSFWRFIHSILATIKLLTRNLQKNALSSCKSLKIKNTVM